MVTSMDMPGKTTVDFCLLIPYYNNFDGLIKSLNSVQYEKNKFLILIVDDGSTQILSLKNIRENTENDLPVYVINLSLNKGIVNALNNGLEWIQLHLQLHYIARLDCGDICTPERFYKQVNYLDKHPEVGLIGSWCIFQNPETQASYRYTTPTKHQDIIKEMHFRNVFMHPTVMFRFSIVQQGLLYPENFPHAEDYAFFWSITDQWQVAVIPEFLVICEWNSSGISPKNRGKQLECRKKIVVTFATNTWLKWLGLLRLRLLTIIPSGMIRRLKMIKRNKK